MCAKHSALSRTSTSPSQGPGSIMGKETQDVMSWRRGLGNCSERTIADGILNTQQLFNSSLHRAVYTQDPNKTSNTDRKAGRLVGRRTRSSGVGRGNRAVRGSMLKIHACIYGIIKN